jgi:hypothetical protein
MQEHAIAAWCWLVATALLFVPADGYSEQLGCIVVLRNFSTTAAAHQPGTKRFTKHLQRDFAAGLASAIGVHKKDVHIRRVRAHFEPVSNSHGMKIEEYSDNMQLGAPPYLLKGGSHNLKKSFEECADTCLLFRNCKYGTFISEGDRKGECWLAQVTHKEPQPCGMACTSFSKEKDNEAKQECTEDGFCTWTSWVATALNIDVHIVVPDHTDYEETGANSSIVHLLGENTFPTLLAAKLDIKGMAVSAQQLSIRRPHLLLQAKNKYTDGKKVLPRFHGILDKTREQDELPEEEELEFGAVTLMMLGACIIIWCMYKQNRGENPVHSLCGNWSLARTEDRNAQEMQAYEGYQGQDEGGGEQEDLQYEYDDDEEDGEAQGLIT